MIQFVIDGEDFDIEKLGDEAMQCATRMQELQADLTALRVRDQETTILLNAYAEMIKKIANPDPTIQVVK